METNTDGVPSEHEAFTRGIHESPPHAGQPEHAHDARDPLTLVTEELRQFERLAKQYAAAYKDTLTARARSYALQALFFTAIGLAALAIVLTSAGLLIVGVAGAVAALCGASFWVGALISSIVLVAAFTLGIYFFARHLESKWAGRRKDAYRQVAAENAKAI